jgi:hypothetical protein
MPIHFPDKIKMCSSLIEDIKYIMPPLDLTRTNKKYENKVQNLSNYNNNNSQNTKANSEDITLNKKQNFESEEWTTIIKSVGLTEEEMDRFLKNKFISKLIEAIDNLIGLVLEKRKTIDLIQYEKSILNNQINAFKKDNVNLTQNYLELKEKLKSFEENKIKEELENKKDDDDEINSSLVL